MSMGTLGGIGLVILGLGLAAAGVRLALTRPRPASLGAMLLAPAGLLLAYLGAAWLLDPGIFG